MTQRDFRAEIDRVRNVGSDDIDLWEVVDASLDDLGATRAERDHLRALNAEMLEALAAVVSVALQNVYRDRAEHNLKNHPKLEIAVALVERLSPIRARGES